jgi:nitroimidazol reductase NimA-like FMN-containing flavoprotein (pyridoxamine 5'-phosphate oxidase superfamily)
MTNRVFIYSREEIEHLLHDGTVGFLGLSRNDEPYTVPLNYAYVDGKIIFHCSLSGKKLDFIRANPNVCFCMVRQSNPIKKPIDDNPCHEDSESVICKGIARIIEDLHERQIALNAYNRCYRPNAEEISAERASRCTVVEIEIIEASGRSEHDRQRNYWSYVFK